VLADEELFRFSGGLRSKRDIPRELFEYDRIH
jgi:hypothetical protein